MALEIPTISDDARSLTIAVVQVMQVLDLYQAEVARILHLQCDDIGRLAQGQELLKYDSEAWALARDFIRFYQLLFRYHGGQGVAMRNWLRRTHENFAQTPQLMLVDEDRLQELIDYLQGSRD